MYLISFTGGPVYERKGGGGFTLVEALREVHGVFGAVILRESDMSVAVARAGSDTAVVHVSRDLRRREVRRRKVRARVFLGAVADPHAWAWR